MIVASLLLAAILFGVGARTSRGVTRAQFLFFWSGWIALALALLSPLHALGEVLFSAHMTQHEILMLSAAPLLVLSRPLVPMLWAVPAAWRKGLGQWAKRPSVRGTWHAITLPITAWWI